MHVDRYEATVAGDVGAAVAKLAAAWKAVPAAQRARGLFVPADELTLLVHRQLAKIGALEATAIVSSDNDVDLVRQMDPAPATMDLNHEAIAQQAVERLLWRMRKRHRPPAGDAVRPAYAD